MGIKAKKIDLIGDKFGLLTVTGLHSRNEKSKLFWNCICECGRVIIAQGSNLKSGHTRSCGCLRRLSTPEASSIREKAVPKFGKDEFWKPIVGYEGYYEISNYSRIRSLDNVVDKGKFGLVKFKGRIVTQCLTKASNPSDCYLKLALFKSGLKKQFPVHRLVATAFIPNPENKPQVNHKNGIKYDNRIENLEWATQSENTNHAYATGLATSKHMQGENNQNSKLNYEKVMLIRNSRYKISRKELAKMFSVSIKHIDRVRSGERWGHI